MAGNYERRLAGPSTAGALVADRHGLGHLPMIMMYHNVAEVTKDPKDLCVAPSRFAKQMAWLERHGLRGVSIGTLVNAMRTGQQHGLVGITFDDGYAGLLDSALPELLRHGFTATMFILSGLLGKTNEWDNGPVWPLMSADEIGELAAAGMEIGSHGATHLPLIGVKASQLQAEVYGSRTILQKLVGAPIRGFAYPYGYMDAAARRAVRDAGYDYACAVHTPLMKRRLMGLPRIAIVQHDGAGRLMLKRLAFRGYTAIKGKRR